MARKPVQLDRGTILAALDQADPRDLSAAFQRRIVMGRGGRKQVLRPCSKCGVLCGARELKYQHKCGA